jgi:tetratricopeptide (TPR) repeat protein
MPRDVGHPPYEPCPCGSGKKYRFCCMKKGRAGGRGGSEVAEILSAAEAAMSIGDAPTAAAILEKGAGNFPDHGELSVKLSHALFELGDVAGALERIERAQGMAGTEPDFCLADIVKCCLLLGLDERAAEAGRKIMGIDLLDDTAILNRCKTAARLGWHEETARLCEEGAGRVEDSRHGDDLKFLQGAALANLSDFDGAKKILGRVDERASYGGHAAYYAGLLEKGQAPKTLSGRWPYFDINELIGRRLFEQLFSAMEDESAPVPPVFKTAIAPMADAFFLWLSMYLPDKLGNGLRDFALLAGRVGSPAARKVLEAMAFGFFGTEESRFLALKELVGAGAVEETREIGIYLGGRWRRVRAGPSPRAREERERSFSEESRGKLALAMKAVREERWGEVEAITLSIDEPASGAALCRLAVGQVLFGLRRKKEARRLIDAALDKDPSLALALMMKSNLVLDEQRIEEAVSLLRRASGEGLPGRRDELGLQAACELRVIIERMLLEGKTGVDAIDRLADLAGIIERNKPKDFDMGSLDLMRAKGLLPRKGAGGRGRRTAPGREHPVSARHGIGEALGNLSKADLLAIFDNLGLRGAKTLSVKDLLLRLERDLGEREVVERAVGLLGPGEIEALRALLEAGGVMALPVFADRFGYRDDDGVQGPTGVLGRLAALGLACEGFTGGAGSVLVPLPLRKIVGEALASR